MILAWVCPFKSGVWLFADDTKYPGTLRMMVTQQKCKLAETYTAFKDGQTC